MRLAPRLVNSSETPCVPTSTVTKPVSKLASALFVFGLPSISSETSTGWPMKRFSTFSLPVFLWFRNSQST